MKGLLTQLIPPRQYDPIQTECYIAVHVCLLGLTFFTFTLHYIGISFASFDKQADRKQLIKTIYSVVLVDGTGTRQYTRLECIFLTCDNESDKVLLSVNSRGMRVTWQRLILY